MFDIYCPKDLKQLVELSDISHLIMKKPVPHREGFYSLKYKNKVFYNNLWTKELEEMRGLVVDSNYNIVTKPFTKIYNIGIEPNAPYFSDDTPVVALRKVNGFMATLSWDSSKQDIFISNAGANHPIFIQYIRDMIDYHGYTCIREACRIQEGKSLLFECVHPEDPHIVVEKLGMYLLDIIPTREREVLEEGEVVYKYLHKLPEIAEAMGIYNCLDKRLKDVITFSDVKDELVYCDYEGYVVKSVDGTKQGKLKSPYYLSYKFLARKNQTKLTNILDREHYKHFVDEEFYDLCDYLIKNCKEDFINSSEQDRLKKVRTYFENR